MVFLIYINELEKLSVFYSRSEELHINFYSKHNAIIVYVDISIFGIIKF